MGLYALWLFTRLEGSVDEILRDNYQFVLAGQAMKESAEGMDSALSLALAGEEERGSKLFQRYTPVFEEHLRHQRGNISVPGDGEVNDKIIQAGQRALQVIQTAFQAFNRGVQGRQRRPT